MVLDPGRRFYPTRDIDRPWRGDADGVGDVVRGQTSGHYQRRQTLGPRLRPVECTSAATGFAKAMAIEHQACGAGVRARSLSDRAGAAASHGHGLQVPASERLAVRPILGTVELGEIGTDRADHGLDKRRLIVHEKGDAGDEGWQRIDDHARSVERDAPRAAAGEDKPDGIGAKSGRGERILDSRDPADLDPRSPVHSSPSSP